MLTVIVSAVRSFTVSAGGKTRAPALRQDHAAEAGGEGRFWLTAPRHKCRISRATWIKPDGIGRLARCILCRGLTNTGAGPSTWLPDSMMAQKSG